MNEGLSKEQILFCNNLMKKLEKKETHKFFKKQFLSDCNKPMDLSKVKEKLQNNEYESIFTWIQDIDLVWRNVKNSFSQDKINIDIADDLSQWFNKKCKQKILIKSKDKEQDVSLRFLEEIWILKNKKLKKKIFKLIQKITIKKFILIN